MAGQSLEQLIEEVLVDAYDVYEQLGAFCQVFEDVVTVPSPASIVGVDVEVIGFDYSGDERRSIVVRCRRGAVSQDLCLADVRFPEDSDGGWLHAAYRSWLGLEPYPARPPTAPIWPPG